MSNINHFPSKSTQINANLSMLVTLTNLGIKNWNSLFVIYNKMLRKYITLCLKYDSVYSYQKYNSYAIVISRSKLEWYPYNGRLLNIIKIYPCISDKPKDSLFFYKLSKIWLSILGTTLKILDFYSIALEKQ